MAVETRSKKRQSSAATVVFKLLDINDHTPRFSKPIYNFTVLDTLPYGAAIPQVKQFMVLDRGRLALSVLRLKN